MSTEIINIKSDNDGILKPKDIHEGFKLAQAYLVSGVLPERYNNASMILAAMQYAYELGLKPMTALRQMANVKGTWCVFGDIPLGIVQASGKLEYIREKWYDKEGTEISPANKNMATKPYSAVCTLKRIGDAEIMESFFTMDEADQAGLTHLKDQSKPGVWQKYPKRMLRYRARSQALKDKFADCLNGIAIAEYDRNMVIEEMVNVTPPLPIHTPPDTQAEAPKKPKVPLSEKLKPKVESAEVIEAEIE